MEDWAIPVPFLSSVGLSLSSKRHVKGEWVFEASEEAEDEAWLKILFVIYLRQQDADIQARSVTGIKFIFTWEFSLKLSAQFTCSVPRVRERRVNRDSIRTIPRHPRFSFCFPLGIISIIMRFQVALLWRAQRKNRRENSISVSPTVTLYAFAPTHCNERLNRDKESILFRLNYLTNFCSPLLSRIISDYDKLFIVFFSPSLNDRRFEFHIITIITIFYAISSSHSLRTALCR